MLPSFPFSALVGQDLLKRALLLCVIQPRLGGVLIRGTKGVAKTTAVRALPTLLPSLETVAGCPFQRAPGEDIPDWPLPAGAAPVQRPIPLVELPLGATEDRVLGSLHLEKALAGQRAFEPGLLAAANRGILYIDEVNLLPDHLVDILLDAAASGVHQVEREGLSLRHPAHFVLVGTMNPEEGDLRPQLLDRFGLVVDVADLTHAADRAEAVRRRLAFEADPEAFVAAWQAADTTEARRVQEAQQRLPGVQVPEELFQAISARCLAEGVEGLRADLTLCKAACAWAAYQGRDIVEASDVEAVAELALRHRRTPPPPNSGQRSAVSGQRSAPSGNGQVGGTGSQQMSSAGLFLAKVKPLSHTLIRSPERGRGRILGSAPQRQALNGRVRPYRPGSVLSWSATLRAATQHHEGPQRLVVRGEDLHGWPRRGPAGCLLLFVVDASGSMAAWQRMRQTKAAVLALLLQAYQRRDRVALLAFRGHGTELVLPPARGLQTARQAIEALPVGGATPLAHGLTAAHRLIRSQQRREPRLPVWTVLLTDGRTNVPLLTSDPWQDALAQARALAAIATEVLVVDTELGGTRFGQASELARLMQARCLGLEEVLGRPLPSEQSAVSGQQSARRACG